MDAGLSFAVSEDELPEGAPHDTVAIAISGGLGRSVEGAFDRVTFSALFRGGNGGIAEEMGREFDRLWLDSPNGFLMGDAWVIGKGRFGGPPAYVGRDQSEQYPNRYLRQATYYVEIEY